MTQDRKPIVVPRPAAALILARDGPAEIEIFLVQRSRQADFVAGAYVFPGGVIDAEDRAETLAAQCVGLDDATRVRYEQEGEGVAFRVAAVRECFEECGLLLAYDSSRELVRIEDAAAISDYGAARKKLIAGEMTFGEFCSRRQLRPAIDKLSFFTQWITPPGLARRYDARFFLAAAPGAQTASHDGGETTDSVWIRPEQALEAHARGQFELVFATIETLQSLARFPDTRALLEHSAALGSIMPIEPRFASERGGKHIVLNGHFAYAEVKKLDPHGTGTVSSEIVPGVATQLSQKVRRLTAPNPGVMTGPGTNTYLLGAGDDIAIIDPGPASEEHLGAILAQSNSRVRWILVTHTHRDHSPGALLLKEATGAQLLGMPAPLHEHQDQTFIPDRILRHGERLDVAGCSLRVLHTPGHASNHLCYLLEDEQLLFTGDHIMQGSTVVINPPDGDMTAYFASLRLLLTEEIAFLAPGHGFLVDRPHNAVERLLEHRIRRENKVLDALAELGEASLERLVLRVYDDVTAGIHPVASRSLLAHLIKLGGEGRVREAAGRWQTA
jgi:glyoxylase-like metal-dependent hydrolase (beta-lactamase superfamily II)/8-oxo-dGTP pyrophosphatase MutT (NUDIX family)